MPVAQSSAIHNANSHGIPGYNMGGFGGNTLIQTPMYQPGAMSEIAQGKQRTQDAIPVFDEAAFEQAFMQAEADAAQDVLAEAEQRGAETVQADQAAMVYDRQGEMDPLLMRIRETRPGV